MFKRLTENNGKHGTNYVRNNILQDFYFVLLK